MSFDPILFLSNVEKIFSNRSDLKCIRTWSHPTKMTWQEISYPAIFLEIISGSATPASLSMPNRKLSFYVRFVAVESQEEGSLLGEIFAALLSAVRDNPLLEDPSGAPTCEFFGAFEGREIGFDIAATEVVNQISKNALRMDVPCMIIDR